MAINVLEARPSSIVPEAGHLDRQRSFELERSVDQIDRSIKDRHHVGRLHAASLSFDDARQVYLTDQSLKTELAPSIDSIFDVLQERSAAIRMGEKYPGITAREQMLFQDAFKYLADSTPDRADQILRLWARIKNTPDRATIIIPPRNGAKISLLSGGAPEQLQRQRQEITRTITESAMALMMQAKWQARISRMLHGHEKKSGHPEKNDQATLESGFTPWVQFMRNFLRSSYIPGNDYTRNEAKGETRAVDNMHRVVAERLLLKLVENVLADPNLVIIRPPIITGGPGRVQLLNQFGQGVEVNQILTDPNYLTDPENQVYWGREFIGLVDSAASTDVADKIRDLLQIDKIDFAIYQKIMYILRESAMIEDPKFATYILPVILNSASGKPYEQQVKSLLSGRNGKILRAIK